MADEYEVFLTRTAENQYKAVFDAAQVALERGDTSNSNVTKLNMVDEAIDKIIPHEPFDPKRALSGPLKNIFRVKKGRFRICYVGSSKQKRIAVLYISETLRKEGDTTDPYVLFATLVLSGEFDSIFESFGVRRPQRGQSAVPPAIH